MAVIGRHDTSSNCYTTAWVVQDDANERFDLTLFALVKHYLNLKGRQRQQAGGRAYSYRSRTGGEGIVCGPRGVQLTPARHPWRAKPSFRRPRVALTFCRSRHCWSIKRMCILMLLEDHHGAIDYCLNRRAY